MRSAVSKAVALGGLALLNGCNLAGCSDEISYTPAVAELGPTQTRPFDANNPAASCMVLTFDDEFADLSVSSDGALDGTRWTNHLWYEKPIQSGQYSVTDGVLRLGTGNIVTVNSDGQGFAQKYGYFEARIKVPGGKGTWPAFWLINNDRTRLPNLPASELDIMEGQGVVKTGYFATLHRDSAHAGDKANSNNFVDAKVDIAQQFHRYGALWDPWRPYITFYFDGRAVSRARKYDTTDLSPMMVILGNGYGDMIGRNAPDASTPHPAFMQVDYVRVYQFRDQHPVATKAAAVAAPPSAPDPTGGPQPIPGDCRSTAKRTPS
jgi:hypothetical protein